LTTLSPVADFLLQQPLFSEVLQKQQIDNNAIIDIPAVGTQATQTFNWAKRG